MRLTAEQIEAFKDNSEFSFTFRDAIRGGLHLPLVRTLDFGAGKRISGMGPFGMLFRYERVTSYDPNADMDKYRSRPEEIRKLIPEWTDQLPSIGRRFDLVGFHFSLHHMDQPLEEIIAGIKIYHPLLVAVVEYDFQGISREGFDKVFVAESEQNELIEEFGGDMSVCYEFHRKWGRKDYERALETNGLGIIRANSGKGAAQHKFFMLAS